VRILIAEDEAIIRLDLRAELEAEGFEVCAEARDGAEAVEQARLTMPDLVIMDVRMPELDGIEAARRITAERPVPIVILSAHAERSLVLRAVDAGISAYLVKPFDLKHLVPTIETALARHRELMAASAAKRPRRRRLPADDRRQEIISIAGTVFYEKGYEATTIQDIADAVGILKGSLYHYISSKEDLLYEVIRDVVQAAAATLPRSARAGGSVDEPMARLERFLAAYAGFVVAGIAALTVSVRDDRGLSPERRQAIDEVRATHRDQLTALVIEAQEGGVLREELDPVMTSEMLLGMGDWVARRHAAEGPSPWHLAQTFVQIVLGGLTREEGEERAAA
jgi:DNA-binding NarL/FixJ family response regulator